MRWDIGAPPRRLAHISFWLTVILTSWNIEARAPSGLAHLMQPACLDSVDNACDLPIDPPTLGSIPVDRKVGSEEGRVLVGDRFGVQVVRRPHRHRNARPLGPHTARVREHGRGCYTPRAVSGRGRPFDIDA